MDDRPPLLLSIDFEDWHQLVHRRLGLPDWDRPHAALERQTAVLLDLLDELDARATFFLLGMSTVHHPDLVREIVRRGHEPACHGFAHARVYQQTKEEFRADLERALEAIADAAGRRPVAYRAAGLLHQPADTVGLRGARGGRSPLRLEPVRLAADPRTDRRDS